VPVGHYQSPEDLYANATSPLSRKLNAIVPPFSGKPGGITVSSCPTGTYQDSLNSLTCIDCPVGYFCGGFGAAEPEACGAGEFTNSTGTSTCNSCAPGTYNDQSNATVCQSCSPGFYSLERAEVCSVCDTGTVTDVYGSAICTTCPINSEADFDRQKCICQPDYYMPYYKPHSNVFVCDSCPVGGDCTSAGTAWYNIKSLPGWWRANNHTLNFYECFIRSYCLGGAAAAQTFDASYTGVSSVDLENSDALQGILTIYDPIAERDNSDPFNTKCLFKGSSTPCTTHRCGIMCAFCEPGYQSDGTSSKTLCETVPSCGCCCSCALVSVLLFSSGWWM
jgi:hypothetical protein